MTWRWCWPLGVVALWLMGSASLLWSILIERTFSRASDLILRLVALTFAVNFVSTARQARGLIGPCGILPLQKTLLETEERMAYRAKKGLPTPAASRLMSAYIVRAWRFIGEGNVCSPAWCGCALGVTLVLTPDTILAPAGFVLLYLVWYLYKRGMEDFANLQWDSLLLESGILCMLLALPLSPSGRTAVIHMVQMLVVRLHCGAGLAKLTSGDRTWASLTAMTVHHETQPLPTPLAPYLHALPFTVHRAATLVALVLEIATGPLAFTELVLPNAGLLTFAVVCAIQAAIVVSGFYGYFSYLSVFLAVSLLDDQTPLLQLPWIRPMTAESTMVTGIMLVLLVPCALLYFVRTVKYTEGRCTWLSGLDPVLRTASMTFHFATHFSLFSNMVETRQEIIIEGSEDGVVWQEYEFKYKPDKLTRLKIVPPLHMPRLDWRMWFLPSRPGCLWYQSLLERLLEGSPDVLDLFESVPFKSPRFVRSRRYVYRFSNTGWTRKEYTGAKGGSYFGKQLERTALHHSATTVHEDAPANLKKRVDTLHQHAE